MCFEKAQRASLHFKGSRNQLQRVRAHCWSGTQMLERIEAGAAHWVWDEWGMTDFLPPKSCPESIFKNFWKLL